MAKDPRQRSERRRRILEAARYFVLRHGLKAAGMEAIAREASVAKATLYAYFPDKASILRALLDALGDEVGQGMAAALAADGDVIARAAAALTARHKIVARWREGSPHADELLGDTGRGPASELRGLDLRLETGIVSALEQAGIARPRPLARLLIAAADGLARHASSISEIGPAIRLLTERLLRPEPELLSSG